MKIEKKEVHKECIRLIRKFITPFQYDIPGYNREFVDPFKEDKKRFSRLIKDCSLMGMRSAELTAETLRNTFSKDDKVAHNKGTLLLMARDQLSKLRDKNPNFVFNYYKKHNNAATQF